MSTIRGARERARIEVTAAIKDEARKQLAEEGAPKLSLRAVARELGMVSSALYRYFPSRDDLLTALIVDAFDAIGAAAEQAVAEQAAGERTRAVPPAERWVAVACAVREWALAHPHEYALIYGSPVPGYIAPMDTVGPAARVGLVFIDIVRGAFRAGDLTLPPLADALRPDAERMAAEFAEGVPPESVAALVAAWAQLFGLISFELFGQFNRVVEEREQLFRQAAGELARSVGLRDAAAV
ncbi:MULTISPECIES: TetR/AcrR family transcriptional regulator [Streptomyces]|uniref:TetR/AcrR family transcriptional regulator n=1 Tax=Streptomyces TaxID=1883 RepID=UPI0004C7407C|nr:MULTISPECIES: TetR/AcrR family transcriptional regulator [Streptomyces]MDX2920245.1 TetR/AcrR family transcriptional regulator [Streptomyces sp. NE06-03C]MDX3607553.1 TetR/AcrR family transcriptional regulator [Streptomyces sp. FL06-04B]MDX3737683.1 TetR/AcrR family transcriptional regulator [Streptomyces sp. ID01-15D]